MGKVLIRPADAAQARQISKILTRLVSSHEIGVSTSGPVVAFWVDADVIERFLTALDESGGDGAVVISEPGDAGKDVDAPGLQRAAAGHPPLEPSGGGTAGRDEGPARPARTPRPKPEKGRHRKQHESTEE